MCAPLDCRHCSITKLTRYMSGDLGLPPLRPIRPPPNVTRTAPPPAPAASPSGTATPSLPPRPAAAAAATAAAIAAPGQPKQPMPTAATPSANPFGAAGHPAKATASAPRRLRRSTKVERAAPVLRNPAASPTRRDVIQSSATARYAANAGTGAGQAGADRYWRGTGLPSSPPPMSPSTPPATPTGAGGGFQAPPATPTTTPARPTPARAVPTRSVPTQRSIPPVSRRSQYQYIPSQCVARVAHRAPSARGDCWIRCGGCGCRYLYRENSQDPVTSHLIKVKTNKPLVPADLVRRLKGVVNKQRLKVGLPCHLRYMHACTHLICWRVPDADCRRVAFFGAGGA